MTLSSLSRKEKPHLHQTGAVPCAGSKVCSAKLSWPVPRQSRWPVPNPFMSLVWVSPQMSPCVHCRSQRCRGEGKRSVCSEATFLPLFFQLLVGLLGCYSPLPQTRSLCS